MRQRRIFQATAVGGNRQVGRAIQTWLTATILIGAAAMSQDLELGLVLAGSCTNNGGPVVTGANGVDMPDHVGPENNCNRSSHCFPPRLSLFFEPTNPACDPWAGSCEIQVGADIFVPENSYREGTLDTQRTFWFLGSSPPGSCPPPPTCIPMAYCGEWQFGQPIDKDTFKTYIKVGFNCADPEALVPQTYSILTSACYLNGCQQSRSQVVEIEPTQLFQSLCRKPRKDGCPLDNSCTPCSGPGGGVDVGGDGPGFGESGTGPGARLRYLARGAGSTYTPGWQIWRSTLGRNWSHDYAMRVFLDPVDNSTDHVWLVTELASFREYSEPDGAGIYQVRSPSDDYRQLELLPGGGWRLHELAGSVHLFDAAGLWLSTTDRNSKSKLASYDGLGRLEAVEMPDETAEAFSYGPDGKLASITETGVGGLDSRVWLYSWAGSDLTEVNRSDGTLLRFEYADTRHPGYMTRAILVAVDSNPTDNNLPPERTLAAYSYDDHGNVIQAWSGAATFAAAVEKFEFSYDDPADPTETTATITLQENPLVTDTVIYTVERDVASEKQRVTEISGGCPVCGSGPNSQFYFDDPAHYFLPTRVVDGEGTTTEFLYDDHGRTLAKTEALGLPGFERTTEWAYDPIYPAFPSEETRDSVVAGCGQLRTVARSYDAGTGNLDSETHSGCELVDGSLSTFTLTTGYDYTGTTAGGPTAIDGPLPGTDDRETFTYDPTRGDQILLSRTHPLLGTTSYLYDGFNRRVGVKDVNEVLLETQYDTMDRVTALIHRSSDTAVPGDPVVAGDLQTRYFYSAFGDLTCTVLPQGNAVQQVIDTTNGRVTQVIRGQAVATPSGTSCLNTNFRRERLVYTYDTFGHRTLETASWDAGGGGDVWTDERTTRYDYSSRCHLDKVVQAPGRAEESTTEYAYDCNGNVQRIWDGNHPSAGQTAPASTRYAYDALDRLVETRQPWGPTAGACNETEPGDPDCLVVSYAYDSQDHLIEVLDGERGVTTYDYSDRDLMTSQLSEVSGETRYEFNERGQLEKETDSRGAVAQRTVDGADRVELIDYSDDALDVDYVYGAVADPVTYTRGRLMELVRDPAGAAPHTLTFTYDRFGRTLQEGELAHGDYDENGNARLLTYPGGLTATTTFDLLDRPATLAVNPGSGSVNLVSAAGYKAMGPMSSLT